MQSIRYASSNYRAEISVLSFDELSDELPEAYSPDEHRPERTLAADTLWHGTESAEDELEPLPMPVAIYLGCTERSEEEFEVF